MPAPKKSARRFADGGAVKETTEQLLARIDAKYGTGKAAQAEPQPAPQPQPTPAQQPAASGILGGAVNALRGRQQQIDKAAGYAAGGKIEGPGTATSDDISATVRETGEPIKVSNRERIISAAQDAFLEGVARGAGYDSLDAMLEDGTGKPVGPTIKAGKRAAEDGLPPELDPFANRGRKPEDPQRVAAAIAAPPTLVGSFARTEPAGGALSGPASGITVDSFGQQPTAVGNMTVDPGKPAPGAQFLTGPAPGVAPKPAQAPGRDASGIITAESAAAASGLDMQRPGGISGTYDGKGVNDIIARENKARGEMIDSMIAANGGNGFAALPDQAEAINLQNVLNKLPPDERAKYELGRDRNEAMTDASVARAGLLSRGQDMRAERGAARDDVLMRGQDLLAQRATDRNDVMIRGQDLRSDAVDKRIAAGSERRGMPTLAQERGNQEIDAARERIAGMTPDEIKRKTANYTATGRENPDFDPTLAKAVSLANRRKVGADAHFDERQQRQPAALGYDRAEVAGRFRSERGMDKFKLGNDTENGVEVLDAAGKVVGHYR
jgi:hypothetical protein